MVHETHGPVVIEYLKLITRIEEFLSGSDILKYKQYVIDIHDETSEKLTYIQEEIYTLPVEKKFSELNSLLGAITSLHY